VDENEQGLHHYAPSACAMPRPRRRHARDLRRG
jgi:hypothetical protein